jgi:Deoxynucleoside kinases
MPHWFLAIEGVIGVGKTTLARMLAPALQARPLLERFEENPFLPYFYQDRARYAFPTQIFFLLSRYRQHQELAAHLEHGPVISDYMFAKDRLFARLNLTGDELALYEQLHQALAEKIPTPTLVLYLRADTDTLMARIALRDRPYERGMDRGYIERLRLAYEAFFATYPRSLPDHRRHPQLRPGRNGLPGDPGSGPRRPGPRPRSPTPPHLPSPASRPTPQPGSPPPGLERPYPHTGGPPTGPPEDPPRPRSDRPAHRNLPHPAGTDLRKSEACDLKSLKRSENDLSVQGSPPGIWAANSPEGNRPM